MLDYKRNIKSDKIEEFNERKRRIMALTIDINFVDDASDSVHLMHVLSKHDAAINGVQLCFIRAGKKGENDNC